jgi:thiamine biosynthesis lipoprotein ApbE
MADTLTARGAPAPPAPAVPSTFTFDAIGTRWCIDTDEPLSGEVRDRILDRIRRFDRTYSCFRPDSLVSQVAAAPAGGRFEFPEDSVALFDLYDGIQVGLEHPLDPRLVIGVANLQNRALCASAVNRRAWGDGLHHVLDARTGAPATEVVATWVVADDAALADGLATALFFTGVHRLAEIHRFAYVRMLADGRAERSPDFDGELFT